MIKRVCLLFLMLCVASPALAQDEDEPSIVGAWVLAKFEVNGEEQEDDDAGQLIVVFNEDGTMQGFESPEAFEDGEADEVGWYELEENGDFRFIEDTNDNGELDDDDRDAAEVMMLEWVDDLPVLSASFDFGEEKMELKVFLQRHE